MKNKLLFAFLIFVIISLLISCGTPADGGRETTDPAETTTDAQEKETAVPDGSILLCSSDFSLPIVRTEAEGLKTTCEALRIKLKNATGRDFSSIDDNIKYQEDMPQIICGPIDCPAFEFVSEGLGLDQYKIKVYQGKLVIAANTAPALESAVNAFADYVKQNIKEGELLLPATLELVGEASNFGFGLLADIPVLEKFESVRLNDCGDGFEQATFFGTAEEGYTEFCKSLADSGYSLYTTNKMGEVNFSTYTKGELTLHCYRAASSGEMRVIASKGANLPSTEKVEFTKVCEPGFTVLGLEKGGDGNGLGAIIGLEDGSFIMIDGGHATRAEADDIYNTLRSLAPDPDNIIIRAWIITHGHADHYGGFTAFSNVYAKSGIFTVESFIYNFCNVSAQRKHGGAEYSQTLTAIKTHWKDAEIYKPLAGQVYKFAGCDIEILYAFSDFIPQIIGEEKGISDIDKKSVDSNIETTVFRAAIGGQSLLVTGDTSKVCVDEMIARYGSYLKSDIMTVPHHGYDRNSYRSRNGSIAFYDLVKPSVAVWPCGEKNYTDRAKYNSVNGNNKNNAYLVSMPQLKENIVAGKETKTIILPYTAK